MTYMYSKQKTQGHAQVIGGKRPTTTSSSMHYYGGCQTSKLSVNKEQCTVLYTLYTSPKRSEASCQDWTKHDGKKKEIESGKIIQRRQVPSNNSREDL